MSEVLVQSVMVALFVAFAILFMGRSGIRTKLRDFHDEIDAPRVAEMLDCDFCLSFWMCVAVVVVLWFLDIKVSPMLLFTVPPLVRIIL